MSNVLYRVVYCSRNLIGGSQAEQSAEIGQILQTARANNSRQNVSGALLYNDGYFAQVLEGPQSNVERIFERIQQDTRHDEVTVLEGLEVDTREFADWSMAHVEPASNAQSSNVSEALHEAMGNPGAAGHEVLVLMRSLVVRED